MRACERGARWVSSKWRCRVLLRWAAALGCRNALFRFTVWGNPFADERFPWPYPMYDRMRASGPVAYGRLYRQWFVFGYNEVREVLRSPHTATAVAAPAHRPHRRRDGQLQPAMTTKKDSTRRRMGKATNVELA